MPFLKIPQKVVDYQRNLWKMDKLIQTKMAKHFIRQNEENSFFLLIKLHTVLAVSTKSFFSFLLYSDNIKFTYQQRCCNSILTSFEKLIDINWMICIFYRYVWFFGKFVLGVSWGWPYFSEFRFTVESNLILCWRQLNFLNNTKKCSVKFLNPL